MNGGGGGGGGDPSTIDANKKAMKKQIFILSGQSNMSGRGGVRDRIFDGGGVPQQCNPHPSILRFTAASQWAPAQEPLHADIDTCKTCGVGPGMAFANALITRHNSNYDGATVGLVPCAVGGTAIKEWEKGSRLYEEMVRRAKESTVGDEEDGEIKGVVWFQGESDTLCDAAVESYKENFERFVEDLRSDLDLPSLPFIQVAIASGDERLLEKLREVQLGINLPNVVCVDAKGLPLNEDNLHLSAEAQVILGSMLADAYVGHFRAPN